MSNTSDRLIGKILGGCRILRLIGKGGMGSVYEGFHIGLEKKVAVKVLPARMAGQEEFLKRFLREAKAAAKLEHPHIVQVMNVGQEEDDYFITMQLVEGESLGQIVERQECLPVERACRYTHQTASALGFAHAKGFIHRDVKPDNLLIGPDDKVKVTDFGLAGQIDQRSSITTPDQILGTPYFMSPEQCRGEVASAQSDIYSLGATLYFLLTGAYPFQGDSAMATLMKHINEPLVPPRRLMDGLPEGVSALVVSMMEKSPQNRPRTMQEVQTALEPFLGETPETARALAPPAKPVPASAILVGGAILATGIVALLLVLFGFGAGRSEAEKAFETAEAFAREHPAELARIAKRYAKVAKDFPDTPQGQAAQTAAKKYGREAEQDRKRDEQAAANRAEALYRKGDIAGASRVLEAFAKKAPKNRKTTQRFASLRAAASLLTKAEPYAKALQFFEAAEVLSAFPSALEATEYGRDVRSREGLERRRAAVKERAEKFMDLLTSGAVNHIPRYLSKKRGIKEDDLLVTAGRVIYQGVKIQKLAIDSVQERGKKILVRVRGKGARKRKGETWTLSETVSWILEGNQWVLEGEGKGDRWLMIAIKIRTEDLIEAINAEDDPRILAFLTKPDTPSKTVEGIQKLFLGGLRWMARVTRLKGVTQDKFEVNHEEGTIFTQGTPIFQTDRGEKRADKPWRFIWEIDEGTFKIRFGKGRRK
ncbi:MAG: serine/threonine protein kinase [Planctomycetota bacterium]|jgi:tetratricopeptide (TPR) repeat protein